MNSDSEKALWVYTDNKNKKTLFQCDGSLPLIDADRLYTQATGSDPIKQMSVGVFNTHWTIYQSRFTDA